MENLGFVPENQEQKRRSTKTSDAKSEVVTVKIKPTWADVRYDFYCITDALIIAPNADRKFAKELISVIKNTTKIERRHDLETKKTSMSFFKTNSFSDAF